MLYRSAWVLYLNVRKGMRAAIISHQHRVALREVTSPISALHHLYQPAVCILALTSRDTLRDDRALGVLTDMDHLGTGIGLLLVVSNSN